MTKNTLIRMIALTMMIVMVMAITGCVEQGARTTDPSEPPQSAYTIRVTTRAGDGVSKCAVEIFSDASKTTRLYKGITNNDGEVIFTAPVSSEYVAVLSKVNSKYALEEHYRLVGGTTTIVLSAGVMDEEAMDNQVFKLGDPMMDFTVTLPDNSEVTLSELLKTKKAVVLNFWFMNCPPCKGEFPYIQEGFEQVSEDVAVLALNPVDSTAAEIAQFQADKGYTFTMSKCDPRWQKMLTLYYFPTTIVIDRYGDICLIDSNPVASTEEFLNIVNYFIQDDYEQNFFKSVGQIPTVNN